MDTKGWDVISVCSFDKVNEALVNHMEKEAVTFNVKDDELVMTGTFAPWKIIGGSDDLLHIEIPIKEGTINTDSPKNISGIIPVIQINLTFLDDEYEKKLKNLQINLDETVTILELDKSGILRRDIELEFYLSPLMKGLASSFRQAQAKLAHIFAQVNLVPPESSSWLAPKKLDYTCANNNLSILALTEDNEKKDTSNLDLIDENPLDENHEVVVVISSEMFLKHLILPALNKEYSNSFQYDSDTNKAGCIKNITDIACPSHKYLAVDYYPKLTSFTVEIENDRIINSIQGSFDITGLAGASVNFTINSKYKVEYDKKSNSIKVLSANTPVEDTSTDIPWYDYVAIGLSGGLEFGIVAAVVSGVAEGILVAITHYMADSVGSQAEDFSSNMLINSLSGTVKWNGIDNLLIDECGLSQSFYVKG